MGLKFTTVGVIFQELNTLRFVTMYSWCRIFRFRIVIFSRSRRRLEFPASYVRCTLVSGRESRSSYKDIFVISFLVEAGELCLTLGVGEERLLSSTDDMEAALVRCLVTDLLTGLVSASTSSTGANRERLGDGGAKL